MQKVNSNKEMPVAPMEDKTQVRRRQHVAASTQPSSPVRDKERPLQANKDNRHKSPAL